MYNSAYLTNVASTFNSLVNRAASLTSTTDELATTTTNLSQVSAQLSAKTTTLLANMVFSYSGVTGADGTFTVDYSALELTSPPNVVGFAQLTTISDVPVFMSMIGVPTLTEVKLSARQITGILEEGLLPEYAGVEGVPVYAYVRPS
ncbi:hypothetical protein M2401_000798 [Pseudomonas sp. JUb42]|uniref:hypothetical protein n=1 Tax=Pseudomonas sp. JUb42 TaxID=2940611 RepID=UPI0021697324|nr:hypothetical protein [Pseudomonas sp. JUb42]MCS3467077.1 hypothetical protein [Pseudomonas sp. JUb42]